jgi:small-conductance mechanosensitive channel
MENMITGNVALQKAHLDEVTAQAADSLMAAGSWEIILAAALPLLAYIIGQTINHWIDRQPQETIHAKLVDFMASLLSPLLSTLFTALAVFVLEYLDIPVHILPFIVKLSIAWFAIRLVVMMSTRQSAGWFIALVIIPITLLHLFGIWEPATEALEDIKITVGKVKLNAFMILQSLAAIVALFWVTGFIVRATDKRLRRVRRIHVSNRVLIMKIFQILLYFIVFLIGMQMLGVDLTALSVLGGALGVGIGFGLQKIASNFISGIILLFEKSISVDDLIELADGTAGFIRQNAARYTLLETFDGREVFIPNEEFITQRVTTLTHSNRRGRVEIPVGVAYGSDPLKVQEVLLSAAKSVKRCMADPAPVAVMVGFGESSLDFKLFFWIEDVIEGRLKPIHEAMVEILRLFAENNISIPFPHQVQVADPASEERFAKIEKQLAANAKSKKSSA